jgi:putative transposase
LMRNLEAFCCIEILTYALMPNHFHILCEEPERRLLSDLELLERIEAGFGGPQRKEIEQKLLCLSPEEKEVLRNGFLNRMFNVSNFIKELKGTFAQWYNRGHDRYGVLWSERFKSVLIEGGEGLAAVAAYIELNPVRAGLCSDPKDYRFCGYAELVGTRSEKMQRGIGKALGCGERISKEEVEREYRKLLFVEGSHGARGPAFDFDTVEKVVNREEGEIPLPTRLRCRIKYMTDGAILGSRLYVERQIERLREKAGKIRARSGVEIPSLSSISLWALRGSRSSSTG